jgi:hypothetical protein
MYEVIPLSDFKDEFRNYLGCWETIVFSGVAIDEGPHLSPAVIYIWSSPRLREQTQLFESPSVPDKICLFKIKKGTAGAWPMFDKIIDNQSWQLDSKTISFAQFSFVEAGFLTSAQDVGYYSGALRKHVATGPKLLVTGLFANKDYLHNNFRGPIQQEFQKAPYLYHTLEDATAGLIGIRIGFDQHFGTLQGVLNIPIQLQVKRVGNKLICSLDLPTNLERMSRELRYVRESAMGRQDVRMATSTGKRERNHIRFSSSVNLPQGEEGREIMLLLGDKRVASAEVPRKEVVQKKPVEKQIEAIPEPAINEKAFPVLGKPLEPPPEIQRSLSRFRQEYPNPEKVAFIMMEFGETSAHERIAKSIKKELTKHGITGVRADDRQYHDDLHYNVVTYLHGSGFGVAVFERIEREESSPNVSLEVGYMLALQKPVCLLKDKTLKTLPTDIISKLYRPFDPQHPARTIPAVLSKWLSDNGIA